MYLYDALACGDSRHERTEKVHGERVHGCTRERAGVRALPPLRVAAAPSPSPPHPPTRLRQSAR